MAALSAPGARRSRRSLIGLLADDLRALARKRGKGASRLAVAISDHAMTFAGMAAVDVGMFHLGPVAGWCAVGVSIVLADHKIQEG